MTRRLHLRLLRAASWIVPRDERADWLAEWTAELWYVERKCARATDFCLGAFRDAWWLRRYALNPTLRHILRLETPRQCLTVLTAAAALAVFFAFHLPGARNALVAPPYRNPGTLMMISTNGNPPDKASVTAGKYLSLAAGGGHWLTAVAFYQPAEMHVRWGTQTVAIRGARASDGLFDLLGVPIIHVPHRPELVVTESTWRRFGERGLLVDGRRVEVAAIIANDAWRLPGSFDAWLLLDESGLAALPAVPEGFVIGRGRPNLPDRAFWHILIPKSEGQFYNFVCMRPFQPVSVVTVVGLIFASCMILLGTASLPFGNYPIRRHFPRSTRIRRWLFLWVKLSLVLVILIFGALDQVAVIGTPISQVGVVVFFLAFRWVITDQKKRCPICLRVLANPVRIGRPSQTFLEWYGTELMCTEGHGLLHVAETTTSYCVRQEWTYLDSSWSGLFSDAAGQTAAR